MLYRQLERLETHLHLRARETMQWGLILAGVVGAPLQLLAWLGRGSLLSHVAAALLLASFTVVPGVLMISRGRRTPALVDRLRREPLELRALSLNWVVGPRGPQGELRFQFRQGERCYVRLGPETARAAYETLRAAYPWTRAPALAISSKE